VTSTITFWLHIVAATAWVGPQLFLVLVIPALRALEPPARARALRVLTQRFGWLGGAALVVLVLSGISNLFQRIDDGFDVFNPDLRYLWIFVTKMSLLGLAVILTALHSFVVGPRQLRLMEASAGGPPSPELARARRATMLLSALVLLASLGILFAAALLANHAFSFQPV
jgi:uncharacterized membrane protein